MSLPKISKPKEKTASSLLICRITSEVKLVISGPLNKKHFTLYDTNGTCFVLNTVIRT